MGRTPEPLYKDPKSGNWFARWYEGKKRFLLSLETPDKIEALRRLPIVRHLKISWTKYRTTFLQFQDRPKGQVGNRTSGPVFQYPAVMRKKVAEDEFFNAEYLSAIFKEIVSKLVPQKNISLKNLRQTATDILEKRGLTDDEIDATLGHHQIKTALLFV